MSNLLSIFIVPLAVVSCVNFLVYSKYSANLCEINERTELLLEYYEAPHEEYKKGSDTLQALNYPEARVEVVVRVVIIVVRLLVILL